MPGRGLQDAGVDARVSSPTAIHWRPLFAV
jgi:hypothetical protein